MMLCPTQEVLKYLKEMTETGCGFVDGLYLIFFFTVPEFYSLVRLYQ